MANNITSPNPPGVQIPTSASGANLSVDSVPKPLSDRNAAGVQVGYFPVDELGFYGATPIVQPIGSGSKGSYTYTLTQITTALQALGLIAT